MKLVDPVPRVLNEELARRRRSLEIDRAPPVVGVLVGEIVWREFVEVVPVGPEMVVDDVENDGEAGRVRAVDEPAEIVRRAVDVRGRVEIDAVVAPTECAGRFGDGHQLDDRDAEARELRQLRHRRRPRPFRRERTGMQLVDYLPVRPYTAPTRIRPPEQIGVHVLGGAVRTVRLRAGGRIGTRAFTVEAERVGPTRARIVVERVEMPGRLALHGQYARLGAGSRDEVHRRARGRPDANVRTTSRLQLRADTEPASDPGGPNRRHQRCARRRSRPVKRAISAVSTAGSTGLGRSRWASDNSRRTLSSVLDIVVSASAGMRPPRSLSSDGTFATSAYESRSGKLLSLTRTSGRQTSRPSSASAT